MSRIPVIAIVDVGKTNKKLLLFDEQYQMVYEHTERMEQTVDEDGFACEDVHALTTSVREMIKDALHMEQYLVKAINFTGYGASFVYIDKEGEPLTPLYNYLKPYPKEMQDAFYQKYGGEQAFARVASSPVLGSLNSGMQVLRIKREKPEIFSQVAYALHLPQYLGYIFTDFPVSEITSIGCHTNLWDFTTRQYHAWVHQEEIDGVFPPIMDSTYADAIKIDSHHLLCGIGLHDSSSALIPYLMSVQDPFLLISTGTWSISLNPFDEVPLTDEELAKDCLCYLQYNGKPVKASRLFLGNEHEECSLKIAKHFSIESNFFKEIKYDPILAAVVEDQLINIGNLNFAEIELDIFTSAELAYHMLISILVSKQKGSSDLILKHGSIKQIYVDGGFGKNEVFMYMLANVYPGMKMYSSEVPQASALGAALAIHSSWNASSKITGLIQQRQYS
jgi:sugar (pentulose or hexulose) kinase